MAPPRTVTRASCFAPAPSDVPVSAEKEAPRTGKRRWRDKLRWCNILDAVRPSSRRTVEQRRDVDVEKQRLQREFAELQARRQREVKEVEQLCNDSGEMQGAKQDTAEYKATRRRSQRSGGSALQKDNDGSGVADDVNSNGRPRKNIQNVRSPYTAAETESESPTLVELLFPIGVLDKPPTKSVGSAGPEKGPASLTPLLAAAENAEMTSQEAGNRTPVDRDLVDQRSEARVVAERQARQRRRSLRWSVPSSQNDSRPSNDENGAKTESVINLNARPKKGILKVRPVDAATKKEKASPTTPVELLFPTGFLSKPPRSFRSSGPEHDPVFLMSVIADARKSKAPGSRTRARVVDRDLVDQWSEAKENSLRRGRYLRDYCPFRRDEEEEESARVPEETTLPPEEAGPVEEVRPVKTGLPFDSPAAEAEFVKAIVSRHVLKDDFINRYAFKRSCERFAREQSLPGEKQALPAVARNKE